MASQQNKVDLQINAQVTGTQQLREMVAEITRLNASLKGVGIGPQTWLGAGPMGEPAQSYLQGVISRGGYAGMGPGAPMSPANQSAMVQAALEQARTAASRYGVGGYPPPPLGGSGGGAEPYFTGGAGKWHPMTGAIMPVMPNAAWPPGFQAAYMREYYPGSYANVNIKGPYQVGPGVGAGPVVTSGQKIAAYADTMANWGTVRGANAGYSPGAMPGFFYSGEGEGLGITAGGKPQMGRAAINLDDPRIRSGADNPLAMAEGARKAKPQSGHMMWGLMYSLFFSTLFGGFQQYMMQAATGKRDPSGWATMMPAGMSLGMAAIGAAINPMLAIPGAMIGQLLGQIPQAGAAGATVLNQTIRQYTGMFGQPARTRGGGGRPYSGQVNWLQALILNSFGENEAWQKEISVGGLTGLKPDQQREVTEQLGFGTGGSAEELAKAAGEVAKLQANPWLEQYYQLTPEIRDKGKFRRYPKGDVRWTRSGAGEYIGPDIHADPHYTFSMEGMYAHYWESGMEAAISYAGRTGGLPDYIVRPLLSPIAGQLAPITRAGAMLGFQGQAAEARMGYQARIGSAGGYFSAMQGMSATLNAQQGNLIEKMLLGMKTGMPVNKMMEVSAQLEQLGIARRDLILKAPGEWPISPSLQFNTMALETAVSAGSRLGPGWGRYSKQLGLQIGSKDSIWTELSGRSVRQNMNALIGDYGKTIKELQVGYDELERTAVRDLNDERGGDYPSRYDTFLKTKRKIAADFQARADPYRKAQIGLLGQMQTGWMEQLVSEEWGMPPHAARVARTFNYAGAGAAYEGRFGHSQQYFGGRLGVHGRGRGVSTLSGMSDRDTGLGGAVAEGLQVNVTIKFDNLPAEPRMQKFASQLTKDIKTAASSAFGVGGEVPGS